MKLLWIFVLAPLLVAGRREDPQTMSEVSSKSFGVEEPVTGAQNEPDISSQVHREPFSVQEVATSVVTATTELSAEVCFKTHVLYSHWGNTSSDRQLRGDIECIQADSESLKNLAVGRGVLLSQSTDLVVHVGKKHDFSVKSVSTERLLMVLGVETSRTVNVVEKIHAKYLGSTKPDKAQMVVAGIDWPHAKHVCFEHSSALSLAIIPVEGKSAEEMPHINQNGAFCICIGAQSRTTQETIKSLEKGNLVTMTITHSMVRYQTTGDEQLKWDLDVSLRRGTQMKAHWISYGATHLQKVSATFQGAIPSPTDDAVEFCFKLVGGAILRFEKYLQEASIQATLSNLENGTNVNLGWENEWITYENDQYSTGDAESKNFIGKIEISTTQ